MNNDNHFILWNFCLALTKEMFENLRLGGGGWYVDSNSKSSSYQEKFGVSSKIKVSQFSPQNALSISNPACYIVILNIGTCYALTLRCPDASLVEQATKPGFR